MLLARAEIFLFRSHNSFCAEVGSIGPVTRPGLAYFQLTPPFTPVKSHTKPNGLIFCMLPTKKATKMVTSAPPKIHTSNQIAERLKEIYKLKHIIKL